MNLQEATAATYAFQLGSELIHRSLNKNASDRNTEPTFTCKNKGKKYKYPCEGETNSGSDGFCGTCIINNRD